MIKKTLALPTVVLLLAGCSSSVKMTQSAVPYAYSGEKYGIVEVSMAEGVNKDSGKSVRVDQLNLDSNIKAYLVGKGIFDAESKNRIHVKVNKIRIRNAFNAIMFGFMSGSDNLGGTVTLKNADNNNIASFDITASYALGGSGGGQDDARLGWLSEKFAELTVNSILGVEQNGSKKKKKKR